MKFVLPFSLFLVLSISFSISSIAQTSDTTLLHREYIYFDFGKYNLRSSELSKLDTFIRHIPKDAVGFIRLTAHTDSIGTSTSNDALSEKRGKNVIDYLVAQRIPNLAFYSSYNGEKKPISDNKTESGRQVNRRVELTAFQIRSSIPTNATHTVYTPPKPTSQLVFRVLDETTQKEISSDISYRFLYNVKDPTFTQIQGNKLNLSETEEIEIAFEFFAKGYFHNDLETSIIPHKDSIFTIYLKPIHIGATFTLKELFFYPNEDRLLPVSIPELVRLKNSLLKNPTVQIELGGHINYPNVHPSDVPHWANRLSESRAKTVYEYLIQNGIDEKRLTHKGYGNTQMIYPKATQAKEMAKNRRVEIKVLGE